MLYLVYSDEKTGNQFAIYGGVMFSVNAVTTPTSKHCLVDGGSLIRNCEVLDWRWVCGTRPRWHEVESKALKHLAVLGY